VDSRNVAALGAGQQPTTVTAGAGVSVPTTGAPSRYPSQPDGSVLINLFNTGDAAADRVVPGGPARAMRVSLAPHEARLLTFRP
jgi:hypothetical protein